MNINKILSTKPPQDTHLFQFTDFDQKYSLD